jgi:primosomal protein N' (replication factor Y)
MLWTEQPDTRKGPVVRVAMKAPVDKEYTFLVPDELAEAVRPGKRVMVPFGRKGRPEVAFCVSIGREQWTSTLKPVQEVLDDQRLLSDELLELGQWISRYYCCPLGRTLAAMVPEAIRKQSGFRTVRTVIPGAGLAEDAKRSAKRKAVAEHLDEHPRGIELDALVSATGASRNVIKEMAKSDAVCILEHREAPPAPDFDRPREEPAFDLNQSQQTAVNRIKELGKEDKFRAVLLHGVSGSGKTEVYIQAMRSVLAEGKQAIMLVPEIALTTQIVQRLCSRFEDIALVHSGLTGVQRSLTFAAIARGEKRVVIGTRSAVFAPCPDLGLIVVDEEQESSYKNQQSPRFHTRDVAIKRAQMRSIPIVMGTATPSLETWQNCQVRKHFEKIVLPNRVAGLALPAVSFVDLRDEQRQRRSEEKARQQKKSAVHLMSREMEKGLAAVLEAGQQAVLLLNRRGYANYLVCSRCRETITCPRCRVNMVFHRTTGQALCHHCYQKMTVPQNCPDMSCGGKLIRFGMGTERLEEELRRKFPQASIARADSDTMKRSGDYESMIERFSQREFNVLIGTQMIAKGLDFPFVSFVGVANADTSMSFPDFRSAERTFQMITQVAGRAGRAEQGADGGGVVIQSLAGMTMPLRYAMKHDYESFAEEELRIRKRLGWPPYSRLARVVVSYASQSLARRKSRELADQIREFISQRALPADVLGPQSAPLPRLRNQYRFDFLIRAADAGRLMQSMEQLREAKVLGTSTKSALIDVDPMSVL